MVNAWALAASILDGTFDEDYPVTGLSTASSESNWISTELGSVTIDTSNAPEILKAPVHFKYNEDKILEAIQDYIGRTYAAHYSNNETQVQTLDLIDAVGDAAAFCRSNILKYASRYDKKGSMRLDIEKIIHYAVLLYHFEGLDKESTNGYETF